MKLSKVLKIGGGGAIRAISALILLSMLAPGARAGLRQWEPSDYVQTDLVLHYDGIRNAGLDAAHDANAEKWVDLSSTGNDATLKSNGVTTYGTSGWTDNGYMFYRNAWFLTDRTQSFEGDDGDFTIQAVVDFSQSAANLVSWPMVFDSSDGTTTIQAYWNNTSGQKKAYLLADKYTGASGGNTSGRPYLTSAWAGHYLTAAFATASGGGKDAWLFEGTTYPTAHPGHVKGGSSSTAPNAQWAFGSIVSDSGRSDRLFTGKILSIRAYSHKLSEAELAWNRALDEARFYGAASVPESALCAACVPDAVIASSVDGAEGVEANGCYVVDEDGYTFRAAPFASAGGSSYVCTGYTLAVWDEDAVAYGAAVQHSGEYSVLVKQGDKVKITWQWKNESGSLSSVGGYVKDNLIMHFDGICNAGDGRPHDPKATSWANLADRSMDVSLWHKTSSSCGEGFGDGEFVGSWTDDGFVFRGTNFFYKGSAWTMPANATAQLVVDIDSSQQKSNIPFIFCETDSSKRSGAIAVNKGANRLDFYCDKQLGCNYDTRPRLTTPPFKYVTAVLSGNKAAVFTNTKLPDDSNTAANNGGWFVQSDESKVIGAVQNDRLTIGGGLNWSGTYIAGTVKAIRLYSGVLSDAQLEQNRAVDEARFFGNGVPATGCVVVQSAIAGLEGREPNGLYFPDGWTFTAGSATNTVRDIGWVCAGYQLQTWDADSSTWGTQDSYKSSSYTSPSGTSFPSVRITWLWKPVKGVRAVSDYAVDDYVVGGAQLHLDGLAHGDSATVWSDLSGNGRDATLTTGGASAWTKDGYSFAGDAYFRTSASFTLGTIYTMQMLVDWNSNDMDGQNRMFLAPQGGTTDGAIWWKNGDGNIFFRGDNAFGSAWSACPGISKPLTATYLTSLRNGNRAAITTGTAHPTTTGTKGKTNSIIDWFEGTKNNPASAGNWTVGADYQGNQKITTDMKSVRLYDRMLSNEELAWNRSVDNARFFGALTTTNVVEVISGVETAYKVEGEWTFNAPATVTIDNAEKEVAGYRLEVLDSGVWKRKPFQRGQSFRYSEDDEAVGGKTVKLIWSPEPDGLMIIVR